MRISDGSSDVCSSDLHPFERIVDAIEMRRKEIARAGTELIDEESAARAQHAVRRGGDRRADAGGQGREGQARQDIVGLFEAVRADDLLDIGRRAVDSAEAAVANILPRSEEHTSELQSLMRSSYAVLCLNKKNNCKISPN